MSSVPIYAINTSCRSADCSHRWPYHDPRAATAATAKIKKPPLPPQQAQPGGAVLPPIPDVAAMAGRLQPPPIQGRTRSYSNSSDGQTPPTSPSPVDVKGRSSSLNHLDRPVHHLGTVKSPLASKSYSDYRERERIMDMLGVFN